MRIDQMKANACLAEKIEVYIEELKKNNITHLPTEEALCMRWECEKDSLRTALRRLVNEGILYVEKRFYYIAEKKLDRDLWRFNSFSGTMEEAGYLHESQLISFQIREASKKLAGNLKLPLGAELYEIERIRYVESKPLAMERSYLPVSLFPGLSEKDVENGSLYEFLKNQYHCQLESCTQEISITYITKDEGKWLAEKEGTAAFMLQGVTFNERGEPVEFSQALTRGDRCIFHSVLK